MPPPKIELKGPSLTPASAPKESPGYKRMRSNMTDEKYDAMLTDTLARQDAALTDIRKLKGDIGTEKPDPNKSPVFHREPVVATINRYDIRKITGPLTGRTLYLVGKRTFDTLADAKRYAARKKK